LRLIQGSFKTLALFKAMKLDVHRIYPAGDEVVAVADLTATIISKYVVMRLRQTSTLD
jgi:hypothetical protein